MATLGGQDEVGKKAKNTAASTPDGQKLRRLVMLCSCSNIASSLLHPVQRTTGVATSSTGQLGAGIDERQQGR